MTLTIGTKENLKVEDVASILNISQRQVYYLIRNGEIVANKYGGAMRIRKKMLDAYMENSQCQRTQSLESNQHSYTEKTAIHNTGTSNIGTKNKIDGDMHQQEPRIIQLPSTS